MAEIELAHYPGFKRRIETPSGEVTRELMAQYSPQHRSHPRIYPPERSFSQGELEYFDKVINWLPSWIYQLSHG
jgi:hypothetical protein